MSPLALMVKMGMPEGAQSFTFPSKLNPGPRRHLMMPCCYPGMCWPSMTETPSR